MGSLPIYYVFFGFGICGALITFYLYYLLLKNALKIIKFLKLNKLFLTKNSIGVICSLYIIIWTLSRLTYSAYAIGTDFRGGSIASLGIIVGIGYALNFKMTYGFEYLQTEK